MNLYVDSSVVLRIVLGEPDPLPTWSAADRLVASELIRVECLRTIDRARLVLRLDDQEVARHRHAAIETIESLSLVALSPAILERAAELFPTVIGSMDAIHLASALRARTDFDGLEFATHDWQLGTAARAMGFTVEGIDLDLEDTLPMPDSWSRTATGEPMPNVVRAIRLSRVGH